MLLSVITVCRNARATIGEALSSIHRQSYRPIEHIVVDGASTDGTLDVLHAQQSGIARLISEPDEGLYHAMNKGIALATGDYVGFLNADDIYAHPNALVRIGEALRGGTFDAAYGDLVYVRQSDPAAMVRYWRSGTYAPGRVERGWMPAHPTFFVRTALLRKLGGFDTRYRYQADYELMVRLFLKEHISSAYVPEVLVRMRIGGHTNRSLRNVYRGNMEAYRACIANGIRVSPFFILQKMFSRVPQFFARPQQQEARLDNWP